MAGLDLPPRRRDAARAGAGIALILAGAVAILWLVFDERLPTTTSTPSPGGLAVWAVVRVAAAAAIAGGAWLLGLAILSWRHGRNPPDSPVS